MDKKKRNRGRVVIAGGAIGLLLLVAFVVAAVELYDARKREEALRAERNRTMRDMPDVVTGINNFKSKFNVSYVPSAGPNGPFRLRGQYKGNEPETIYLKSVFPYLNHAQTDLPDLDLDCNQTLVFFLTGGPVTKFTGFSKNKAHPFVEGGERIGPFLDGPSFRFDADGRLLDVWGSPYMYFAYDPTIGTYPAVTYTYNATTVAHYTQRGKALKLKGYQIISAGPDRLFGPGGEWTPGSGAWAAGEPGADDMSNFNEGDLSTQR
jgi:hypothetical protein